MVAFDDSLSHFVRVQFGYKARILAEIVLLILDILTTKMVEWVLLSPLWLASESLV